MLWDKTKYELKLKGGCGQIRTTGMHGLIQHLIIEPTSLDTIWSLIIKDGDEDIIYKLIDHEGRLDEIRGLPIGKDKPEKLNVLIYDSTINENFNLIFKVREVR